MDKKVHSVSRQSSSFRVDIQILRGLAVLAVILFHSKESLIPNGYLGVDVFFVISGFVVAPLIRKIILKKINLAGQSLFQFYVRRFWRLIPTLCFVLGASALLIILLGAPSEHWRIAQQGIYTLLLSGNIGAVKFSGNYFSPTPNPFLHTWSLTVEQQFYLGIPILLLLFRKLNRNLKREAFTIVCIGFLSYVTFAFPIVINEIYPKFGYLSEFDFTYYCSIPRTWQFMLGYLAFLFSQMNFGKHICVQKANFGFSLIALILFFIIPINNLVGSTIVSLITFFVILKPHVGAGERSFHKTFQWIGDRSYSLYLVHMPIIYLAKYSPALAINNRQDRAIQTIFAVILTFILGNILFMTVETRSRLIGKSTPIPINIKIKFLILTLVFSIFVLTALNYGTRNFYWGLMDNLRTPPYAGYLDPNCKRDSDSGPPCHYFRKKYSPTVLLIGDSHAGMHSEAIISAAKSAKWSVAIWTMSSCNFVLGKDNTNSLSKSCISRNRDIYGWVKTNSPKVIIVSQFIYRTSNQQDLKRSVLQLKKLVPKIVIVANNPIFPDENDFMVARPIIMNPYSAPLKFRVQEMQFRDQAASTRFTSWASANGFETLIIWPFFCDNSFCHRFEKGKWLYFDDDHLSVTGANKIFPSLVDILES